MAKKAFTGTRALLTSISGEAIDQAKIDDGSFSTWAYDAADDLDTDISTASSTFRNNMVVSDPVSQDFLDCLLVLTTAMQTSAFGTGSLYFRQSDEKWAGELGTYFYIKNGILFKFVNKSQAVIFYNLFLHYLSVKHMEYKQTVNPTTLRGAKISTISSKYATDVTTFIGDSTASYNVSVDFELPVNFNAFDPV